MAKKKSLKPFMKRKLSSSWPLSASEPAPAFGGKGAQRVGLRLRDHAGGNGGFDVVVVQLRHQAFSVSMVTLRLV